MNHVEVYRWEIIVHMGAGRDDVVPLLNGERIPGAFRSLKESTEEGIAFTAQSGSTKYEFYKDSFCANGNASSEEEGIQWLKEWWVI